MFSRLPLRAAYVWALLLAPVWFLHYNKARFGVVAAMRRMGLRAAWWRALSAYGGYGLTLVDRWYIRAGRLSPRLVGDLGPLDQALREPGALVLFGSHCGALEMAVPALEAAGRRIRAVAVPDPESQRLLEGVGDSAADVGGREDTIVADGSVRAGLRMLKALRAGEILAFKADRFLPDSEEKARFELDFFGAPVDFPTGPAEVARLGSAQVWAVGVYRCGPGCFEVVVEQLNRPGTSAAETIRSFGRSLERQVRRRPSQWFNFYPFWPSDAERFAHLPETVPPSVRAGAWAVRAGLASAVVAALLAVTSPGLAALAGLQGGVLGLLFCIALGGTIDADGRRGRISRVCAVLGAAFAVGLPLVHPSTVLDASLIARALLALGAGVVAGHLSPSRSRSLRQPGAPASGGPVR